jgi:hypothetical protein
MTIGNGTREDGHAMTCTTVKTHTTLVVKKEWKYEELSQTVAVLKRSLSQSHLPEEPLIYQEWTCFISSHAQLLGRSSPWTGWPPWQGSDEFLSSAVEA